MGSVEDGAFVDHDFDAWQAWGTDDRHGVFRIFPVNFFDGGSCRRAFSLTPTQLVKRVARWGLLA